MHNSTIYLLFALLNVLLSGIALHRSEGDAKAAFPNGAAAMILTILAVWTK